jgi:DNA replication protein DnaC
MGISAVMLERSNIPKRYWEAKMVMLADEHQEIINKILEKESLDSGVGFLFWGDPGVGKTYISTILCKRYLKKEKSVLFLPASTTDKRALMEIFDSGVTYYERALKVDLLIIDGLNEEIGFIDVWYRILVSRMDNKLPTIITTRFTSKMFAKIVGDDFSSSIMSYIFPINILGRNVRMSELDEIRNTLGFVEEEAPKIVKAKTLKTETKLSTETDGGKNE